MECGSLSGSCQLLLLQLLTHPRLRDLEEVTAGFPGESRVGGEGTAGAKEPGRGAGPCGPSKDLSFKPKRVKPLEARCPQICRLKSTLGCLGPGRNGAGSQPGAGMGG